MSGESRYKMHYVSGGGTQYDGGTWEIKQTAKTYKFTKIKDSFYSSHMPECTIKKGSRNQHAIRDWEDGTFTVYPYQNGTPHYFEPILTPTKETLQDKTEEV